MSSKPNTSPDFIHRFLADESNAFSADPAKIAAAYCPETAEEAAEILSAAAKQGTPVTISGAGTGITGSRVPLCGGIVLCTEKMLKVPHRNGFEMMEADTLAGHARIGVNKQQSSAWVPPGLSLDALRRKEVRVQNVRRQNGCTAPAIELVSSGKVDVDPLVTHHYPLEQTKQAFDLVAGYEDGVVKAIVHVSSESED